MSKRTPPSCRTHGGLIRGPHLLGILAAFLLLSLSLLLGGCANSRITLGSQVVRPDVPEVPERYRECFARLVQLPSPKGGWTKQQAVAALVRVSAGEIKKAECGQDLVDWANGTLDAARGGPVQHDANGNKVE